jgi:cephalosporin hydroxylase
MTVTFVDFVDRKCRGYESDSVKIFIGNQADRMFWHEFRRKVPALDIVIDDGSHDEEHQIVTLEELLPFLRAGAFIFVRT